MMNHLTARLLTVELLTRVEREGAYANVLLQNSLERLQEPRDRVLTTALVNGTMKHRLTLDYVLRNFLSKPLSSLPHEVRGILRSGAFQLLFMDRIPAAAAVNEGVELTKRLHSKYSALVNGVLRKVSAQGWNIHWPDPRRESIRYLSVRHSHPEWMVRRWFERWGLEETEALCRLNNEPAPTWIRTNFLRMDRGKLTELLQGEGAAVETGQRTPESLSIKEYGAVEKLASFQQGLFTIQDESSQLVAHIVSPKPGQKVLDVCSAPGGKTTHLAELMHNQGQILAFDVHAHKLEKIHSLAERLGIGIIETQCRDARELPEELFGSMDRVLVDAPCSGLGVLRRKADLRWQKELQDIRGLTQLQQEILERAAKCVAPNGELVYSTCTTEPEENFEMVKSFRQSHPEFIPVDITGCMPFTLQDPRDLRQAAKGMLQLLPQRHGVDGFFLAKFRRVEV